MAEIRPLQDAHGHRPGSAGISSIDSTRAQPPLSRSPSTSSVSTVSSQSSVESNARRGRNDRGNFLSRISMGNLNTGSFSSISSISSISSMSNSLSSLSRSSTASEPREMAPELASLWKNRVQAAKLAVKDNREKFVDGGRGIDEFLARKLQQLDDNALPASEHKKFEKELKGALAEHILCEHLPNGEKGGGKYAKKEAERLYKQAVVDNLNDQPWNTIRTGFRHDGATFDNEQRPAAQMKFMGNHEASNIFAKDYDNKGVSSGTSKSADHAVNLYATRFSVTDSHGVKSEFKGIRHGINSAYGMKARTAAQKEAREAASIARGKEVIVAALAQSHTPFEIHRAMATGEPLELRMTSTSLVTAMNGFGQTEGKQMDDQVAAWKKLTRTSSEDGNIPITMRDRDNQLRQVNVKFEAIPFNFGVNEAALTHKIGFGNLAIKLDAGWKAADKINAESLTTLLGPNIHGKGPLGGVAQAYLDKNPDAANRHHVETLTRQIKEMWQQQSHRTAFHKGADGKQSALGDPYKMAARVVVLSHELGISNAYNCKSGKDRTGALDGEVKYLFAYKALYGYYPEPGAEFSGAAQELYRKCMRETGNGEIQEQNTGADGNKVYKNLPFNNLPMAGRMGSTKGDTTYFDQMKGLSGYVKS